MLELLNPAYLVQLEGLNPQPPEVYDYNKMQLVDGVNLDVYLTWHGSAADLGEKGEFREVLKKTDIFLPEASDWAQDSLDIYRKIARGDYGMYEKVRASLSREEGDNPDSESFRRAFFAALYNTKVAVGFVDVPEAYDHDRQLGRVFSAQRNKNKARTSSLQEYLAYTRDYLRPFFEITTDRERYILSHFGPTIESLIEANPRLVAKRESKVVQVTMLFGNAHAGIYDALAHKRDEVADQDPSFRFDVTPHYGLGNFRLSYSEQMRARVIRGLEIDDILLAKHSIADQLYNAEMRGGNQELSMSEFEDETMSKLDTLSQAELESLWDDLREPVGLKQTQVRGSP